MKENYVNLQPCNCLDEVDGQYLPNLKAWLREMARCAARLDKEEQVLYWLAFGDDTYNYRLHYRFYGSMDARDRAAAAYKKGWLGDVLTGAIEPARSVAWKYVLEALGRDDAKAREALTKLARAFSEGLSTNEDNKAACKQFADILLWATFTEL